MVEAVVTTEEMMVGSIQRTAEQDMFNDPIMVRLGDRMFPVRELPNRKSREWKKKFKAVIDKIRNGANSKDENSAQATMDFMFFEADEAFADLLFEYSPEINKDREWVLDNATDNQILDAARRVIHLALPFVYRGAELMGSPPQ